MGIFFITFGMFMFYDHVEKIYLTLKHSYSKKKDKSKKYKR